MVRADFVTLVGGLRLAAVPSTKVVVAAVENALVAETVTVVCTE